jgi:homoserine O-acetyltransferase/O-succinyltransferase
VGPGPAARIVALERNFPMRSGGMLPRLDVAYETWGRLDARRSNAVLLFTGLSPSAHAACSPTDPSSGWWEDMVGPGKPFDTQRYFVICVNSLGSCFGSTGPASVDPEDGNVYRLAFPMLTVEDVAAAGHAVVEALEIERLCVVAGSSMGGMTALAYALLYPNRVRALVQISCAVHSLPFAIALRSLQREMIRSDPQWEQGEYAIGHGPIRGMRLARKLGMITYRSAAEWRERFGRERVSSESGDPFGITFEVESYLESHALKFIGGFDANCYLYLSRAMDLFDAAAHGGGSLERAFSRIEVEHALVIGVDTDFLFPVEQQRELARLLTVPGRRCEFHALPSIQGHDSFLVDMQRFRPVIGAFFAAL